MEARCQCRQISFYTPTPAPQTIYICHCTECRAQSSSSYGLTAIFPHFTIRAPHSGAISSYSRPNPNGTTKGYFCTNCGARLLHETVHKDGTVGEMVSVKAGCLVGLTKDMMRDAIHIWTRSAVVDVPEGVEQYEQEPPGGSFKKE
jgi:hypothetical protein